MGSSQGWVRRRQFSHLGRWLRGRRFVIAAAALILASGTGEALFPASTQAAGVGVALKLSPPSIVANGSSKSTATATVTGLVGTPLPLENVTFSTTDSGEKISSPVVNQNAETYSVTITSSTTPGNVAITATDNTASVSSSSAILTQTGSETALNASPSPAATNEQVNLVAFVASTYTDATPSGTVGFSDRGVTIKRCGAVALVPSSKGTAQATCQTSFSATSSPEALVASFAPSAGANIPASSSPMESLDVNRAWTLTALNAPTQSVQPGRNVQYTATVIPGWSGAANPSGSVTFLDAGKPIASCATKPLGSNGTATCTVGSAAPDQHSITAAYSGDSNFAGSSSTPGQDPVFGTINSTMEWRFLYSATFTKVLGLSVVEAPIGSTLLVKCRGRGCPFGQRALSVKKLKVCPKGHPHCQSWRARTMDLGPSLRAHPLDVGAKLTVEIVRFGWVGKYYLFTIRPAHTPRIKIGCLAPGSSRPGGAC